MSSAGGNRDDEGDRMSRRFDDDDIERVLAGDTADDPSLEALGRVLAVLGEPDEIDPATAARHTAAASRVARRADAAAEPSTAPLPWHRHALARLSGLSLAAKLLLGAAVAVAATGGAATGGVLPDPIQSAIADGVAWTGIDLPNPRLATSTTTTITSTTTVPEENDSASTTTSTTEPDDNPFSTVIPGSYVWAGTACDDTRLTVRYTVTASGELRLDGVDGDAEDIRSEDDRIRVEFSDQVRVEIRLTGDGVTTNEDLDCEDDTESTTTTTPDDDSDDAPQAADHTWTGTSCSGKSLSIAYSVTSGGTLQLGTIAGDTEDVATGDNRVRVSFVDGVDVEIRLDDGDITLDERHSCDGDSDDASDDSTTTTTTEPHHDEEDDH